MTAGRLRLFAAVELPREARSAIADGLAGVRAAYPGGKWVPPDNLHLTVKFIGDVPAELAGAVAAEIDRAVGGHEPFCLELAGAGLFGSPIAPRVLWIGASGGSDDFVGLAQAVDASLRSVGIPAEGRPMRPHLTVARGGGAALPSAAQSQLAALQKVAWYRLWVNQVALVSSVLRPQGPLYERLSAHELRGRL